MQDIIAKSIKPLTGQALTAESEARVVSVYQVFHFVYSINKTRSYVGQVHTYLVTAQGNQLQGLVRLKGPTSAPQRETTGSQAAPAFLLAESHPRARSCRVSHVLGNALGEIS